MSGDDGILARSMPLVFERCGAKLYAKTPAGEIAWGDNQGLYEWRRVPCVHPPGSVLPGPGTTLVRIDYSGSDRQHSSDGQMWHSGPESPGRDTALHPYPAVLGFMAAVAPVRMN